MNCLIIVNKVIIFPRNSLLCFPAALWTILKTVHLKTPCEGHPITAQAAGGAGRGGERGGPGEGETGLSASGAFQGQGSKSENRTGNGVLMSLGVGTTSACPTTWASAGGRGLPLARHGPGVAQQSWKPTSAHTCPFPCG